MKKDTAILIPSYEPEEHLIDVVNALLEQEFPIVVVNDGSDESYDCVFNRIKDKVSYIKQNKNMGKGEALRTGFSFLKINDLGCKYVITCDGDGQHALQDILKIDKVLHEKNEIVLGVRSFDGDVPKRSKVGNNMSKFSRTWVTKDYIQDDQSGLRGFPFRYLNDLLTINGNRYEYEMNVICSFQIRRYRMIEVPIQTIYIDGNSSSHFSPKRDTFRIQRIIYSYSLVGIISFFLTIGLFILANLLSPLDPIFSVPLVYFYGFQINIGLLSLVYPTRNITFRVFHEGMHATVKVFFVVGFFALFYYLCSFHAIAAFSISAFLACFFNFISAFLYYKIKK